MIAAASAIASPTTTPTWRDLAARGASITIAPSTLVTLQAPGDVAADLRAALAWRVEAMRAQLREGARLGGTPPTPVAVPGLVLPLTAPCRWRGQVERYGRRMWVSREVQRALPGLCASCGEPTGHETGDCALCNAARVGALRAEGHLGAPSTWTPPPPHDVEAWRRELHAGLARPDPLPPVAPRVPWTCEVCSAPGQLGRREVEGCGRCALKAADTISLARLGGDELDDDAEGE